MKKEWSGESEDEADKKTLKREKNIREINVLLL